jgi:4,5-DOPA dioxygenase extradiol
VLVSEPIRAAFLGHGSPMNALEQNRWTTAWAALGQRLGRPRAIVVVSAHWYVPMTAVTAMAAPRTIHDFFGFPPELFAVRYPAPGSPEVAEEVAAALAPDWVGRDTDSWGLDHGTWSVLVHVVPDASVPTLQLSVDATLPLAAHLERGRRLAGLVDRDVVVLGSGNVVHNLRRMDPSRPEEGEAWAVRFDEATREIMTSDPARLPELQAHPDWALAVPTPDHFLPLATLAGIAAELGRPVEVLTDGYAYGSLSMTAYTLQPAA